MKSYLIFLCPHTTLHSLPEEIYFIVAGFESLSAAWQWTTFYYTVAAWAIVFFLCQVELWQVFLRQQKIIILKCNFGHRKQARNSSVTEKKETGLGPFLMMHHRHFQEQLTYLAIMIIEVILLRKREKFLKRSPFSDKV